MTEFRLNEPFIVGLDFDRTITSVDRNDEPTNEFIWFCRQVWEWNAKSKKATEHPCPIYLCIHTARDLSNDDNYNYIKSFLKTWNLKSIYLPKRDGETLKNVYGEVLEWPYRVGVNTKIPCSCFVDDLNLGTPKHSDGNINWRRVWKLLKKEVRRVRHIWRKRNWTEQV